MRNTTLMYVAALNLAFAAACSTASGDAKGDALAKNGSGDGVTIAGCLSSSADGRFALTAAPDAAVATAARAMMDERTTHSYVLIGGNNLQPLVGKRVEVTGTLVGKTQEVDHDATSKTQAPAAASGGDTPTVKTTEEVEVEVRQLNVATVREVAPTCVVNP